MNNEMNSMPLVEHKRFSDRTAMSSFRGRNGCNEHFVLIRSKREPDFELALRNVLRDYHLVMDRSGLTSDTQIFSRFILSDIQNQKTPLLQSDLFQLASAGACSIIGQPPAFQGGGLYFLAYHVSGQVQRERVEGLSGQQNAVILKGQNYSVFYSGTFSGTGDLNSFRQTQEVFRSYQAILSRFGMSLGGNCWRTWIYVRDIDNHYSGMVNARKELFDREGLTPATRYIASTGIEAKSLEFNSLVTMDALAIGGMSPSQAERMQALENMCPTHHYGVTFERGQTLRFGDRNHHHISGTASIDANGEVLFPNDVVRQTDRALDNVEALLIEKDARLADMAYFIVYMRNPSEVVKVREAMFRRVSNNVPILFVEGAVCRPAWLVEIEGVAISSAKNSFPDFL